MGAEAVAKAVWGLIGATLIFFGVGFAAYAIFTALIPPLDVAGAAAITAVIMLVGPVIFALMMSVRHTPATTQSSSAENAVANALAVWAKDKPLMAVLGAGLFGAADVLLNRRRGRRS